MRNKKRIIAAVLVASTFALGLTGCGSSKTETADNNATQTEDDANTETTDEAEENADADTGSDLTGSISLAGSTSMEKLCEAMSESFMNKYEGITVTAEYTGSGAGLESLAAGSIDIGNASRGLKDEEKAQGEVENVVAIKEATGSVAQASQLMYLTDGRIDLYSGEDGIVVPLMAIGAIGVISVWSNVAPAKVHGMCQSFFNGDLQTAMKIQREAQPLVSALFSEVNPIPVKKALNLMGREVGTLRSPLTEMTDANAAVLADAMKAYGILD